MGGSQGGGAAGWGASQRCRNAKGPLHPEEGATPPWRTRFFSSQEYVTSCISFLRLCSARLYISLGTVASVSRFLNQVLCSLLAIFLFLPRPSARAEGSLPDGSKARFSAGLSRVCVGSVGGRPCFCFPCREQICTRAHPFLRTCAELRVWVRSGQHGLTGCDVNLNWEWWPVRQFFRMIIVFCYLTSPSFSHLKTKCRLVLCHWFIPLSIGNQLRFIWAFFTPRSPSGKSVFRWFSVCAHPAPDTS